MVGIDQLAGQAVVFGRLERGAEERFETNSEESGFVVDSRQLGPWVYLPMASVRACRVFTALGRPVADVCN
jgi:hypothetical protein